MDNLISWIPPLRRVHQNAKRIDHHRADSCAILTRYSATKPRSFGSVARGDAREGSDIDVLVDLDLAAGNPLLRMAGIGEELSVLLGVRVDVVADELLRESVSATARAELVILCAGDACDEGPSMADLTRVSRATCRSPTPIGAGRAR